MYWKGGIRPHKGDPGRCRFWLIDIRVGGGKDHKPVREEGSGGEEGAQVRAQTSSGSRRNSTTKKKKRRRKARRKEGWGRGWEGGWLEEEVEAL